MSIELTPRKLALMIGFEYGKVKNDDPLIDLIERGIVMAVNARTERCVQIADANHKDEEYGHAAFRCIQIAQQIRALRSCDGRGGVYQVGTAQPWTEGLPPNEVEIAWLLLQQSEDLRIVKLAVYDDDGTWSEAGDWKGESYKDVIDLPIIGWLPFELPKPPKA